MKTTIVYMFTVLVFLNLWLYAIAVYCIIRDDHIETKRKIMQAAFSFLIPFIGPLLVIHLIAECSSEIIPRKMIPWPFNWIIIAKEIPPNMNRDENEDAGNDLRLSRKYEGKFEQSVRHESESNNND